MIQILIWGVAIMIIALGYIAKLVFVLTLPVEKRTKNSGIGAFIVFFILASFIIGISLTQAEEIQRLLGQ
jgi:uncharacterized membrane protein YqjE